MSNIDCAVNIGPKQPDRASSNDLDNNNNSSKQVIKDKIKDVYGSANQQQDQQDDIRFSPETFEVNITLSENVYQVSRLICQMEYDLDWDSYVSELVKEDAFSIKNGDRLIFKNYVDRMLEG